LNQPFHTYFFYLFIINEKIHYVVQSIKDFASILFPLTRGIIISQYLNIIHPTFGGQSYSSTEICCLTTVNVYPTFKGNCEEAFNFYKSVFGGKFPNIGSFKDMPPQDGHPMDSRDAEKIIHVSLPISKETVLMGSDTVGEWATNYSQGNNFSISINIQWSFGRRTSDHAHE